MSTHNATAKRILEVAENYIQLSGVNAFSYKDIQREIGIKTASIHYYFPAKQDLIAALLKEYTERHRTLLKSMSEKNISSLAKLSELGNIFISALQEKKFCLCGMLATDLTSLSPTSRQYLTEFFSITQQWIRETIENGILHKTIQSTVEPAVFAARFLALLEGGSLIARVQGHEYLIEVLQEVLKELGP